MERKGMTGTGHLRTGQLARRAGVSPDTIRHYERRGLLPRARRGGNGYRLFPPESEERVGLIRRSLDLGLSIEELRPLLRLRDSGGVPCRRALELVRGRLREVEERLGRLRAHRIRLKATLAEWERRLGRAPRGRRAHLLDHVSRKGGPAPDRVPRRRRR